MYSSFYVVVYKDESPDTVVTAQNSAEALAKARRDSDKEIDQLIGPFGSMREAQIYQKTE